jgi:hypothetical protein
MTLEELYTKLDGLLKGLPPSGFDAVDGGVIDGITACAAEAEGLGMKSGKQLIVNLAEALKNRQSGGSDESVQLRLTALDFYIKKLQSGSTEDL